MKPYTEEYARTLSHSQVFHGVSEGALKALVEAGTVLESKAGTNFIEQEGKVEGLYTILEGSAKVMNGDLLLTTLGRGAFFGEISLFGISFGATATIKTPEPTKILLVKRTVLDAWGKNHPNDERTFLKHMCVELSRRLYNTSDKLRA